MHELVIVKIDPPIITGILSILGGYSVGQQKSKKQAQKEPAETAAEK